MVCGAFIKILILCISTTVFIKQGNYVGYMFRLLNSYLQAYSLQVKSQDAVYTLGSQCVYISGIVKLCGVLLGFLILISQRLIAGLCRDTYTTGGFVPRIIKLYAHMRTSDGPL